MTSHGIALRILHARGTDYALFSVKARADAHRATVNYMEQNKLYAGICRHMARRMVWESVAHHLRDLTTLDARF